ncbi:myosin heavy chain, striated muscle-like [Branchiostoma floridae]|uniref:Myosin heavy chain, striated muscle-like n=1 Tax=Branchiostoma floridae TaxID=7739 RepID=A0A9J7HGA0_BRAFL|nr:myosin heavy chain, striated muscle-like [Branchiostoma floridae]
MNASCNSLVGEENKEVKKQAKESSSQAEENAEIVDPTPDTAIPTPGEDTSDAGAADANSIAEKMLLMQRMVQFAKVVKKMKEGSDEEKEEALEEAKKMFPPEVLSAIRTKIDEAASDLETKSDLEKGTEKPAEHPPLPSPVRERLRQSGRLHPETKKDKHSSDEENTESSENHGRAKETAKGPESPKIILQSGEKDEATKIVANSEGPAGALAAIMKAMALAKERQASVTGAEVEKKASKASEEMKRALTTNNGERERQVLDAIKHAMNAAKGLEETSDNAKASKNNDKERIEVNKKDSAQKAAIQEESTSSNKEDAAIALAEAIKKQVAIAKRAQGTPTSPEAKNQQVALAPENEERKLEVIEAIKHAMEAAEGLEEHTVSVEEDAQVPTSLDAVDLSATSENKEEEREEITKDDSTPTSTIAQDLASPSQDGELGSDGNVFNVLQQVNALRNLKHMAIDGSSKGEGQVTQKERKISGGTDSVNGIVDSERLIETLDEPLKSHSKAEKTNKILETMAEFKAGAGNQNQLLQSKEETTKTEQKSENKDFGNRSDEGEDTDSAEANENINVVVSESKSQAELAMEAIAKLRREVEERAHAREKHNFTPETTQAAEGEDTNDAEASDSVSVSESGGKGQAELAMEAIAKLRREVEERAQAKEQDNHTPRTAQAAQQEDKNDAEPEANENIGVSESGSKSQAELAMEAIAKLRREVEERAHAREKDNLPQAQSPDTAQAVPQEDRDDVGAAEANSIARRVQLMQRMLQVAKVVKKMKGGSEEEKEEALEEAKEMVPPEFLSVIRAKIAEETVEEAGKHLQNDDKSDLKKEETFDVAQTTGDMDGNQGTSGSVEDILVDEQGSERETGETIKEDDDRPQFKTQKPVENLNLAVVEPGHPVDEIKKDKSVKESGKENEDGASGTVEDIDEESNGMEAAGENIEEDDGPQFIIKNPKPVENLNLAVAEPEDQVDEIKKEEQIFKESEDNQDDLDNTGSEEEDKAPHPENLLSENPDDETVTKLEKIKPAIIRLQGLEEDDDKKERENAERGEGTKVKPVRQTLSQKAAAAEKAKRKAVIAAAIAHAQSHLKAHGVKVPGQANEKPDGEKHHVEDATSVKKTSYYLSAEGKLRSSKEVFEEDHHHVKEDKKPKVLIVKNNPLSDGGAEASEEDLEERNSGDKGSQGDKTGRPREAIRETEESKRLKPASPFLNGAFMKESVARQGSADKEQPRSTEKTSKRPPYFLSNERELKSSKELLENDAKEEVRSVGNEEMKIARPLTKSVARMTKVGDKSDKTFSNLLTKGGKIKITKEVLPEDKKLGKKDDKKKLTGLSLKNTKLDKPDNETGKKKSAKPTTLFGEAVKAGKHRNLAKLREMAMAMAKRRPMKRRRT